MFCDRSRHLHLLRASALSLLLSLAALPALADEPTAAPAPAAPAPTPAVLTAPPVTAAPPAEAPPSLPPDNQGGALLVGEAPQDPPPADKPTENVHSVGLALSFSTGAGFAYRRHWGPTSVQLSAFAVITDRGDSTVFAAGGLFAQRLHTWHATGRTILPSTSALRVVGGLDYFMSRSVVTSFVPFGVDCLTTAGCTAKTTATTGYFNAAAGLGFEFGAIERPGVSLTLDVVLTGSFKDGAFSFLLPLPQLAVLYNW